MTAGQSNTTAVAPGSGPGAPAKARPVRRLVIRGAAWTLLGEGAGQLLRFGGNVVVARWVDPSVFGLMAVVNIVQRGLQMFSDFGFGPNIIQNDRGEEPRFLHTAWTLQIIRGVLLAGIAVAAGWPLAQIYGEPILALLMPAAGLIPLIAGFNATGQYLVHRRMQFGYVTLLEVVRQLASVAVMIVLAYQWRSVWALVVGGIAGTALHTVLTFTLVPGNTHRPAWDRAAVHSLLTFGGWIFLATMFTFLATNADRLIHGRLFGMELFGVFAIAYMMAEVPKHLVQKINSRLILPAVARNRQLPRHVLREKLSRNRNPVLLVTAVVMAGAIAVSDQIILGLYDERYMQGSWMLPILLLGLWPRLLATTINPCLIALGRPQWNSLGSGLKFAFIVIAVPAGYFALGPVGAVGVIALAELPPYVAALCGATVEEIGLERDDLRLTAAFALILAAMLGVRYLLTASLPVAEGGGEQ